jgi:hypothetical protein
MSLEATCSCSPCNAYLRAVRVGRDVVHVETETAQDGEVVLFGGEFLLIVPEHAPATRYTIKVSQIGHAQRFRDHDLHCSRKKVQPESVKPTRPTGVWNRER